MQYIKNYNEMKNTNQTMKNKVNRMSELNNDIQNKLILFSKIIEDETQRHTKKVIEKIIEITNSIYEDLNNSSKKLNEAIEHGINSQEKMKNK